MVSFESEKYIVLETLKKNGKSVKTPVWFVEQDDLVWVVTRKFTGKVKRIKNNNQVKLAPSNFSGKPKGNWLSGIAQIVEGDMAHKIIQQRNKKYGLIAKLIGFFSAKKGDYVVISIRFDS